MASILATFITACATPPLVGQADLLSFVEDGQTTREETYLNLGEPTGLYEDGRIISFRLDQDDGGYYVVGTSSGFAGFQTNLIMVFDEQGVLRRHALVEVNNR